MRVAILGGGIAGLVAAIKLKDQLPDKNVEVTIFERNDIPGGLLISTKYNGYHWDNGMYKFERSNWLVSNLPEIFETIEDSKQVVWLKNNFYDFPLSMGTIFGLLGRYRVPLVIPGLIASKIHKAFSSNHDDLDIWLKTRLSPLAYAVSGLEVYLNKLQGYKPSELSGTLGKHRLMYIDANTRIDKIIRRMIKRKSKLPNSKGIIVAKSEIGGIGKIAHNLADKCNSLGIKINYKSRIHKIIKKTDDSFDIKIMNYMEERTCNFSHLISTIPLQDLNCIYRTNDRLDHSIDESIEYMNMQVVFFIIDKPKILNDHLVVYSFDKINIWKRLIARRLTGGQTSVIVEITYKPNKQQDIEQNIKDVTYDLTNILRLFRDNEIRHIHSNIVEYAYPIYKYRYENIIDKIINRIESDRFQIAGRQGRHLYCSTDGCIKTAIRAANNICKGI